MTRIIIIKRAPARSVTTAKRPRSRRFIAAKGHDLAYASPLRTKPVTDSNPEPAALGMTVETCLRA